MTYTNKIKEISKTHSGIKTIILVIGIGLYSISLFCICFCTDNSSRVGIEALLLGWLAMLTGGAAVTWIANPLIIISWILISKNKSAAWSFGLFASIISFLFLKFHVIIDDEAGNYRHISKIGFGYWLWLSSCLITFLGALVLRILRSKSLIYDQLK